MPTKRIDTCKKCRQIITEFKVIREHKPDTKNVIIRKNYCPNCGEFVDKYKFVKGRESGVCFNENGNNYVPSF
jgi:hypothetical protein